MSGFDEFKRANPFDEFKRVDEALPVREVVRQALSTKPDTAAEVERLTKRFPAPYDVVERNIDEYRMFDAAEGIAERLSSAPLLEGAIKRNARLGKLVSDDVEPLAKIESSFAAVAGAGIVKGTLSMYEMLFRVPDTAQRVINAGAQAQKFPTPVQALAQYIGNKIPVGFPNYIAENIADSSKRMSADPDFMGSGFAALEQKGKLADFAVKAAGDGNFGPLGRVIGDPQAWAGFIAQAAPSLAVALASGGSVQALVMIEALSSANDAAEFEQMTGKTISATDFSRAVVQAGAINGLLEKAGLSSILGAKGKGVGGVLRALVGESSTEAAQTISSNAAANINYDPDQSLIAGVLQSAMGGAGAGGGMAGAMSAGAKVVDIVSARAQKAAAAQAHADTLTEQLKLADGALLRVRSPEQFRQLMGEMAQDAKVYVDGEVLNQLPLEVIQQLPEQVWSEISEAAATGRSVEIPVADVLTIAPGTPLEKVIIDNARADPFADSIADVEAAKELGQTALMQDAQRIIQQATDQETAKAEYDTIHRMYADQLNTAGRFRKSVNEAKAHFLASFYTSYGARVGMTPTEFQRLYPLTISDQSSAPGQQDVVEQSNLFDLTVPEDGNKIRDVKIGDTTVSLSVIGQFNNPEGIVDVVSVRTPAKKRGNGGARLAMQALMQQADAQGVTLRLDASPLDAKTRGVKLTAFYKSLGFVPTGRSNNAVGDPEMIRTPSSVVNQGSESIPNATFNTRTLEIVLNPNANLTSAFHEFGHAFLEIMADIASKPNAPPQIAADMATFLKWAGVADLETWQTMTLEQKRPYHERWAESVEQYVFEGKAPSVELQPLMRRFAAWMKSVYGSIKQMLARTQDAEQTPLNDDIRRVMDRLLATDEQIAQANEVAGLMPNEEADAAAAERLNKRSMADLKWSVRAVDAAIAKIQKEAKAIEKATRAEVTSEVEDMPVYLATDAIARAVKETDASPVAADARLDAIADKYGFTSIDHMVREVESARPKNDLIDELTSDRMLQEHGDLVDEKAIRDAANEAVHNEARARSLATELRAQDEMLNQGGVRATVNAMVAAARQFGAVVVGRTLIRDLRSKAWQHTAAERRAGKAWQAATAAAKTQDAVKAKQDQALNNAAAKALLDAESDVRGLLTYLKKFDKDGTRKKIPPEYLDQIDKLLERVDLRVSVSGTAIDRRASLSKWIDAQHAMGVDPVLPDSLLEDINLKSFKEMTFDELSELVDSIKNIEHIGRLKSKLLAAKDKREFDAIVNEWADSIRANGGKPKPVQLEPSGRIVQFFKGAWAEHRKLNSLIRQMDGGEANGPGFQALIRSMNERGTQEDVASEKATLALAEIFAQVDKLPGGLSGAKVRIDAIDNSLSRAGRLAVALNWGNAQNRQRVMSGDNWTAEQVGAILSTLSAVELKFVNDIWAHIDSYWPDVKAKQLRVSGVVESKVEAEPFSLTSADGVQVSMRGGYYPIKYDPDRSIRAQINDAKEIASDMLRGAMLRPTTRRGHTKARVEEVKGRPIRKDLAPVTQHVSQVIHDLAWHEWAIDANRLLSNPAISSAIRDHYGAEIHRAMTETVEAIVVGNLAKQTQMDSILLHMRANVTRSIMGVSATTALLQPFGLTQSMKRIGVKNVIRGAARWAGSAENMEGSLAWIHGKSDFMRLRAKTFNRDLREINSTIQGKWKVTKVMDAVLFAPMQKMQMIADIPTWIGMYEKALADGADDATAVALADEAVLSAQGGGGVRDLAGVQRDMPFLTQFYSYFSTTLNLVAESTALTDFRNPRAVAGWVGDMALLAMIPAILPALITFALKGGGDDDDPEKWAKRLAEWQANYLLGMFVGLRELPAIWSPFDYQGPPAGKLLNDGKRLVQQANQGEIDDPAVLAAIGFLGTALGLPTTQIIRSYKGWKAWDEGDAPPTSILFGPPPKH